METSTESIRTKAEGNLGYIWVNSKEGYFLNPNNNSSQFGYWQKMGGTSRRPVMQKVEQETAYKMIGLNGKAKSKKVRKNDNEPAAKRARAPARVKGNNPVQNFINAGVNANNKKARSKVAYILGLAIKNANDVPKHILEGANNIRLWNPQNLASRSGGELENIGIRNGVKFTVGGKNSKPNRNRPEWVRHTSPNGTKVVDVVDFRLGKFEQDRDTGINMFNLIYEDYIPQSTMPWNLPTGLTPRTKPTYFIKARFDYNPLKAWAGMPLDQRKKKVAGANVVKKGTTIAAAPTYAQVNGANKANFRKLIHYTDVDFRNNSKGNEDWEPDLIYYNGNGVIHFIELKITEGKAETFPAEAVQLTKGKRMAELILNYGGNRRVSGIKTYFIPWRFGTKYAINFRNWKTAASVSNAAKQAALTNIARIAGVLGPNYDPIPVYNGGGGNRRIEALPNIASSVINAKLSNLRAKRSQKAAGVMRWVDAKSLIALWSIPNKRNGLKKLMFNWSKTNAAPGGVSVSSQERKLYDYTVDIFRRWAAGKSRDSMREYVANNRNALRLVNNLPSQWGAFGANGVWHSRNATGRGALNTRVTNNAPNEEAFAKQLEEAVGVWGDFHTWRKETYPNERANADMDQDLKLFQVLSEGLKKARRARESHVNDANINAFFATNQFAKVYRKFLSDHISSGKMAKALQASAKLNTKINSAMATSNANGRLAYETMKARKNTINKNLLSA